MSGDAGWRDLIARLEAAAEGNSDLDQRISLCLTGQGDSYRPFTRDTDSALTLIPPGWVVPMNHGLHQSVADGEWFWGLGLAQVGTYGHGWVSLDWTTIRPKTPALAVCIAAVMARLKDREAADER